MFAAKGAIASSRTAINIIVVADCRTKGVKTIGNNVVPIHDKSIMFSDVLHKEVVHAYKTIKFDDDDDAISGKTSMKSHKILCIISYLVSMALISICDESPKGFDITIQT